MENGRGLQVVRVDPRGYQLDEDALAQLLLHRSVVDCPVAVISVAGAYRGGKSFLLDVFLRYLRADVNTHGDGSWLDPDSPLTGFAWRSGSEPDTTGLLLWSQPIIVTLPSEEQVAVILMDTQGTFDCRTTMRDCSTIFALSTLLSSVQIYNLKDNIRENDLQHLQLFTAYGRLVLEDNNGETPFQKLKFLVRDWCSPTDYDFGAEGGRRLLANRLGITDQLQNELRDLRQHIRECFRTVDCFLMPHPGLDVTRHAYDGNLRVAEENFKQGLRELVPSILSPRNLTLKLINSERVTGRELFQYFRAYMAIFSSDELPEPRTVMRATAEVAMLSAVESARRRYQEAMESRCGPLQPSMIPSELREQHTTYRDAALREFRSRRLMDNQRTIEERAQQLQQELDQRLPQYEIINEAKRQRAYADAKEAYEECFRNVSRIEELCMHPADLDRLHRDAVSIADNLFNTRRRVPDGPNDEERSALLQSLNDRFNQFRLLNENNNTVAVTEAQRVYMSYMDDTCGARPCKHLGDLDREHDEAFERAVNIFTSRQHRNNDNPDDIYIIQLRADISQRYTTLKTLNENNNRSSAQEAVANYTTCISSICSPRSPCLHPEDLQREHMDALEAAMHQFHSVRGDAQTADNCEDEYEQYVVQAIELQYQRFVDLNEIKNRDAVEAGENKYNNTMEFSCGAGRPKLSPDDFFDVHRSATRSALEAFSAKRRESEEHYHRDSYKDTLEQCMEDRLNHYRSVNEMNQQRVELVNNAPAAEDDDEAAKQLTFGAAALAAGTAAMIVVTGGTAALPVVAAEAATVAAVVANATVNACNTIRGFFRRRRHSE